MKHETLNSERIFEILKTLEADRLQIKLGNSPEQPRKEAEMTRINQAIYAVEESYSVAKWLDCEIAELENLCVLVARKLTAAGVNLLDENARLKSLVAQHPNDGADLQPRQKE